MKYSDYNDMVFNETDLENLKKRFEKDIEERINELDYFVKRAKERIDLIKQYEESKQYSILGAAFKDGKNKSILLAIKYPDGTYRDIKYTFDNIHDLENKLTELKQEHTVDWSGFSYKL